MDRRSFIKNTSMATLATLIMNDVANGKYIYKPKDRVSRVRFKNITVPLLGLGCMRLPIVGEDRSKIDKDKFQEMVDYAIEHGVNYFDTAYFYHKHSSEKYLGEAIKNYNRKKILIADKMPIRQVFTLDQAKQTFEEQLNRLQTDYIDFYLYHTIDQYSYENYQNDKIYKMLEDYKRQGLIKYLGFSSHCPTQLLKKVVNEHNWDFIQIQLNYFDWYMADAKDNYNIVLEKNIPIVVMEPLRGGFLANSRNIYRAEKFFNNNFQNETFVSIALKWVASCKNVTTVLSGMNNLEQLKENIDILTNFKPIKPFKNNNYETLSNLLVFPEDFGCTDCKYCLSYCPKNINIPYFFEIFKSIKYKPSYFLNKYEEISIENRADKCINCGLCKRNCPQGLDIPNLLKKVSKQYNDLDKKLNDKYINSKQKYKDGDEN